MVEEVLESVRSRTLMLSPGKGLGSGGDSRGADGAEVLGPVRGVSGSPSADLVKDEAVSMV